MMRRLRVRLASPWAALVTVIATYDGRVATLYLNGLPAAPVRDPHYTGAVRAEGAPFVVGCRDPDTFNQLVFPGFINRVRVWNRVLSPDAIRTEAGPHPLSDAAPGLAGSWSFQSLLHGTVPDQGTAGDDLAADSLQRVPIAPDALGHLGRLTGAQPLYLLRSARFEQIRP